VSAHTYIFIGHAVLKDNLERLRFLKRWHIFNIDLFVFVFWKKGLRHFESCACICEDACSTHHRRRLDPQPHARARVRARTHTYTRAHIYTHTHTHTHAHVHAHTHTHTHAHCTTRRTFIMDAHLQKIRTRTKHTSSNASTHANRCEQNSDTIECNHQNRNR